MATLTGKVRKESYGGILIVTDTTSGATSSLQTVYSANGVATALKVSTTAVDVTSLTINGVATYPFDISGISNGVVKISSAAFTSVTTLDVASGGTGQSTYTNGQLLIGNTTGNTLTKATLTAPAAGISITNGTGSITFGLANDLAALEGLSTTGLVTRTASDTYTTRTIAGTADKITVTNGDGVADAPTITIPATLDLSGNTAVAIPSSAGGTTINAAGRVCVDTTSKTFNFWDGAAEKPLDPEISKSVTLTTPTSSEKFQLFCANAGYTITRMMAMVSGSGSPSCTFSIRKGTDFTGSGTEVVTGGSAVTATTSVASITSFNSASISSGDLVWLTTSATSGTVNSLHVTIFMTRTP